MSLSFIIFLEMWKAHEHDHVRQYASFFTMHSMYSLFEWEKKCCRCDPFPRWHSRDAVPLIFCHFAQFIFHISRSAHFRYRANKLCRLRWINFAARSPPTLAISLFHLISIEAPFFVVVVFFASFFDCLPWSGIFVSHNDEPRTKEMDETAMQNWLSHRVVPMVAISLLCVRWAVTWQQISSTPIKINWKIFKWEALDGCCRCRCRRCHRCDNKRF